MASSEPLVINGEITVLPPYLQTAPLQNESQPIKVIYHQSSRQNASGPVGSADDMLYSKQTVNRRNKQSNFNQYLATFTANLASTAASATMAWTSPTLPKLESGSEKITVSKDEGAWLGSLLPLGACLGPIITGLVVGHLGKKWTIIANMLILLFSWLIIALADEIELMYLARFITGIAAGSVFTVIPLYVAEISSAKMRGRLGSYFLFFLCLGFLITYVVGPYTSFMTLVGVSASIPMLCIVTFMWVPESPHFLLYRGRKQEAAKAIEWLRGHPDRSVVQLEMSEIQAAIDRALREERSTGSVIQLMAKQGNAKSLYYACSIVFYQQMVGYNAVLFYSESIFKLTGSAFSTSVSTIIIGVVMFGTSCFVPYLSKLIRIKYLMRVSAIGCGLSLISLGVFSYLKENLHKDVAGLGFLPVLCLVVYISSHCMGLGSYSWVIIAEIFPPHLKSFCSAFATAFCWFLCFVITRFFNSIADHFGPALTFWSFVVVCILALLFFIFQLPDTQGKSFQEIQDLIHGGNKKNGVAKSKRHLFII